MKTRLSLLLGILALAACSNPKEANKANFENAIQAYFDQTPACVSSPFSKFPDQVTLHERTMDGKPDRRLAILETGLFTKSNESTSKGFMGNQTELTVDLSPLGKEHLREESGGMFGKRLKFCYGTYKVNEITRFTEPSDAMGLTMSQVTYTRSLTNIADWANTEAARNGWSEIAKDSEGPVTDTDVLILTNEGWLHDKLLEK